ncbi:MAG: hypothetical protein HGA45_13685, partial [Chloroflexales bacterium]|nr:hypothetical protein [Chloroflexales bacterium]
MLGASGVAGLFPHCPVTLWSPTTTCCVYPRLCGEQEVALPQPFRVLPAASWQVHLSEPSRQVRPIFGTVWMIGGALILALALGAAILIAKGAAPAPAPPARVADWTVLVYMDGDNNLESMALNDLRHMARVGSSAQVAIVAQLDRTASENLWDDTTAGDWVGTRRFLIQPGMEPDAAAAVQDLGEVSTGDPNTLADFLTWGVTHYPARRYALILWSHGAAWQGLTIDEPG